VDERTAADGRVPSHRRRQSQRGVLHLWRAERRSRRTNQPFDDGRQPRVALLRARAALNEEADTVEAARATGVMSKWGSELPPLFLQLVLERLQWAPAVCDTIRATCSTWGAIRDTLRPWLLPRRLDGGDAGTRRVGSRA